MPTHKQCEFCDLTQRCQKLDCYCRSPEVMSEICLCCQSQDVKEDEETTEDPIKKMRTEIDLREASRNFVSAREARSSLIRAVNPRNYLRHIGFDREQIKTAFGKQEKHLDGTLHLHIWITFIRKVDTVNQDTSTQLSEMMRKCKELHTIATYVERTVVDPESAMLSELMSTYASMTVLYLWTLSGLHVCTQPLEIFERSTEIAANGLRTLQSQLCQLRRTPSACLTVMKPTLDSHLVSNVTSGSGDLRPQARPSGLRRTSSVFGTTGWPEPCIPSTTTTANKSSSMMMSSPKRNISSASAIRPPTPDPALDRRDTMCGMSQEI